MGWMQDLYETYENCWGEPRFSHAPLAPICHTTQQAQVEIIIDGQGNFKRASVIQAREEQTTQIPCTEASAGRTGSKPIHHPLCDKLQYVAGDYTAFGGQVTSGFAKDPQAPHRGYLADLRTWTETGSPPHPKLAAILRYVEKGRIVADLVEEGIIPPDDNGKFPKSWSGDRDNTPAIFKALPTGQSPENAFARWQVEIPGDPASGTWQDQSLIDSWIAHYAEIQTKKGICLVTGEDTILAEQHPAKLRHAADKAKLISSNDSYGYTFRGRFLEAGEAAGVGFQVTQKAHNALRWLVARQGYRNGEQVIVAWSLAGKSVPDPWANSKVLLFDVGEDTDGTGDAPITNIEEVREETRETGEKAIIGDAGQNFASRLNKTISGYRAKLDPTDRIVVMAMDAATPGRMAVAFYRRLLGSEFLDRIESWHTNCAWHQNFGKNNRFVGAPAPRDIAEAAYGRRLDEKLGKATVNRLLPCIVDGQPIPVDLVISTVRRASNRTGFKRKEQWEWEKTLGIACALFRGYSSSKENYKMALEENRTSRDYLYGRLLAVAERMESIALQVADENRDTTAARYMQRFSERPFSTWKRIEEALAPYRSRLRSKRLPFLLKMEGLLDEIMNRFETDDFVPGKEKKEQPLSGEYLIGYHCQRLALRKDKKHTPEEEASATETDSIEQ